MSPGLSFVTRPARLRVISTLGREKRERKGGESTRTASLGVEGGRREGEEEERVNIGIALGSCGSPAHHSMGIG